MDYQTTDQDSSTRAWYIIGIIIVLAALAFLYYYAKQSQTGTPPAEVQQPAVAGDTLAPLSSGNTTADISADFNQIPDDTAALDQAAAASAADVSGF